MLCAFDDFHGEEAIGQEAVDLVLSVGIGLPAAAIVASPLLAGFKLKSPHVAIRALIVRAITPTWFVVFPCLTAFLLIVEVLTGELTSP